MSSNPINVIPIGLPPSEFWADVQDRRDTNELLPLLDGRNDLISHFSYFTSLNVTIDRLERIAARSRAEMHHVYAELTTHDFLQRITPFIQRRRTYRFDPYLRPVRRTVRVPFTRTPSTSSYYSVDSSPDPNDIPNPNLFRSPIGTMTVTDSHGSREFPIDVDAIPEQRPIPTIVRRDTPNPAIGVLDRHREHDSLRCFYCNGPTAHIFGECIRRPYRRNDNMEDYRTEEEDT